MSRLSQGLCSARPGPDLQAPILLGHVTERVLSRLGSVVPLDLGEDPFLAWEGALLQLLYAVFHISLLLQLEVGGSLLRDILLARQEATLQLRAPVAVAVGIEDVVPLVAVVLVPRDRTIELVDDLSTTGREGLTVRTA